MPPRRLTNSFAFALLAALLLVPIGCSKSDPVTADNSGLKPATDDSGSSTSPSDEQNDASPAFIGASPTSETSEQPSFSSQGNTDIANTLPEKPPTQPAVRQKQPITIPDGSPQQLAEFLTKLNKQWVDFQDQFNSQAQVGLTQEQIIQDVQRIQNARVATAEKILAGKAEDSIRLEAVEAEVEGLEILYYQAQSAENQAEVKAIQEKIAQLGKDLLDDPNQKIARTGKLLTFTSKVNRFALGEVGDPEGMIKDLNTLLTNETHDEQLFRAAESVASAFYQRQDHERSMEALKIIGSVFQDNPDQQLASEALSYLIQIHYKAFAEGDPDGIPALVESAKRFLALDEMDLGTVGFLAQEVAQNIEFSGNTQPASELYALLSQSVSKIQDPQTADQLGNMVQTAQKRLALIGQSFDLDGLTLEGKPFDWGKYQGKIVLVDFWATWCGPCRAEIPNILQNYEQYHDKGFEVVGVNIDDNQEQVKQFIDSNKIPWESTYTPDPKATGYEDPRMVRYNVNAVPFVILVGRDGKVLALHVRGELLGKKLAEIFGPADEKSPRIGARQ